MTREEALDKLCHSYSGYFDVVRHEEPKGHLVAEAGLHIHSEKYVLVKAAKLWEADNNDGKFDPGAAAMCKYYCANSAFSVVDDGMQILAGVAVAGEHRAQRIWRDLRVDRVSGGTDEMMILTASKFELKKYRD